MINNLLPQIDNTYALGTPAVGWTDLYLSSNINYKTNLLFKISFII
jgi:hypothetical protein